MFNINIIRNGKENTVTICESSESLALLKIRRVYPTCTVLSIVKNSDYDKLEEAIEENNTVDEEKYFDTIRTRESQGIVKSWESKYLKNERKNRIKNKYKRLNYIEKYYSYKAKNEKNRIGKYDCLVKNMKYEIENYKKYECIY